MKAKSLPVPYALKPIWGSVKISWAGLIRHWRNHLTSEQLGLGRWFKWCRVPIGKGLFTTAVASSEMRNNYKSDRIYSFCYAGSNKACFNFILVKILSILIMKRIKIPKISDKAVKKNSFGKSESLALTAAQSHMSHCRSTCWRKSHSFLHATKLKVMLQTN